MAGRPLAVRRDPVPEPGPGELLLRVLVCGVCRTEVVASDDDRFAIGDRDLPAGYSDAEAAPLLCAGIIGCRALLRAELPDGGRLGISGFGASAHLAAQDPPPEPLDSAILFAPVGDLVPVATRALDRGGTLAIAGIHLTDIPPLHYADEMFGERSIRSVTANTRLDGEEFLRLAARLNLRPTVHPFAFDAADDALVALAEDRITGAAVLVAGRTRGPR
jgi:propanol-preferring alcohol dehydrogenase